MGITGFEAIERRLTPPAHDRGARIAEVGRDETTSRCVSRVQVRSVRCAKPGRREGRIDHQHLLAVRARGIPRCALPRAGTRFATNRRPSRSTAPSRGGRPCNSVQQPDVRTPMGCDARPADAPAAQERNRNGEATPLRRFGTPEEVCRTGGVSRLRQWLRNGRRVRPRWWAAAAVCGTRRTMETDSMPRTHLDARSPDR